jgi:concentrative nucleoside transporter, CNT family
VAFKVLPTIIFFSSLMSILYYIGLMQKLVGAISFVMQRTLGTSGAETLSTAGNIFVGQTEAPLLVKPYLNSMTRSELMAVMVGGFATIAGGVMAAYVGMGISPVHLLTASLMSAPAALVIAKIMQPEVDQPRTLGKVEMTPPMEATNVIDAAARGASDGMQLALNVGAMLIAFLGLIYMLDSSLATLTEWITLKATGTSHRLTFTQMMGWFSQPFAWLMGIENKDLPFAGQVLGTRIVGNEFIAYLLRTNQNDPDLRSMRLCQRRLDRYPTRWTRTSSSRSTSGSCTPRCASHDRRTACLLHDRMLGSHLDPLNWIKPNPTCNP